LYFLHGLLYLQQQIKFIMKGHRLSLVAKKLNIGISKIIDVLETKGFKINVNPNAVINDKQLDILSEAISSEVVENYLSKPSIRGVNIHSLLIHFQIALIEAFLYHDSTPKQGVDKEKIKFLFDNIEPEKYPILNVSELEYLNFLKQEKRLLISQYKNRLKLLVKGFKIKPLSIKIKGLNFKLQSLLSTIIPPKLFHVYVEETNSISVALDYFSFSNIPVCQLREAVFHSINSKFLIRNEIRTN
jgi:hypothetical protein